MLAGFDGVFFGGQAEGVEAHRVDDAAALHAGGAADDVGCGVALGVPDMQPVAAGVGEHIERVELFGAWLRHPRRGERLVLVPIRLPFGLDCGVVVAGHRRRRTGDRIRDAGKEKADGLDAATKHGEMRAHHLTARGMASPTLAFGGDEVAGEAAVANRGRGRSASSASRLSRSAARISSRSGCSSKPKRVICQCVVAAVAGIGRWSRAWGR